MAENGRIFPEMTTKAAEAFDAYVALGPDRSLDALAEKYRTSTEGVPTTQLSRLKIWSTKYHWQMRLKSATTARTDARLELAGEYDADTFAMTSKELNRRAQYTTSDHLDAIIKIRESVRKPQPKSASVNVNLNLIIDDLAQKYGLTDDERAALFDDMQADMKARAKAGTA